ncbi:hypothetical protein IFM89_014082 [Coptis chinensis]|uniref:non-specific serine/threonine protein kinase n=1 Tax=Coptis chinensis TaxID=261450 RepID=A0A835IWP6_9MAGN|nr:hypothetical protein IFM89_014082 [Coptis chinensis]
MLVGAYPFEDPEDPRNFRKTIGRIMNVQYSIPDYVHVSSSCRKLLSRIFVANPSKGISLPEIKKHPWFLKNLPKELEVDKTNYEGANSNQHLQSVEEVMRIIQEIGTIIIPIGSIVDIRHRHKFNPIHKGKHIRSIRRRYESYIQSSTHYINTKFLDNIIILQSLSSLPNAKVSKEGEFPGNDTKACIRSIETGI